MQNYTPPPTFSMKRAKKEAAKQPMPPHNEGFFSRLLEVFKLKNKDFKN